MAKNIFVLVNVTYDHYRFQDNIFAGVTYHDCKKFAKENHKREFLFDYESGSEESKEYDDRELKHLWIQKL